MVSIQMAHTLPLNLLLEIGNIVERNEADAGHHGREGLAVFLLCVVASEPKVRP